MAPPLATRCVMPLYECTLTNTVLIPSPPWTLRTTRPIESHRW